MKASTRIILIFAVVMVIGLALMAAGVFSGASMEYSEDEMRQILGNSVLYDWIF